MKEIIRFGLIGSGRIGRLHAKNLSTVVEHAELVCVADVYPELAQKCAKENGIKDAYNDYRRVLDRQDIDAVVVSTSTDTHAIIIEEAALSGKHVFCEKPIALNLEDIEKALSIVERTGVKLQIGFNRRFDANPKKIRRMVMDGTIGKPYILRITSRDPEPPSYEYLKVSGGIFLDMMIHDFDMARYLLNDEVKEVYAAGNVLTDPKIGELGDIDTAIVTLKFHNGAIATIDNCRESPYGYDQRLEIFGSKSSAFAYNKAPDLVEVGDKKGMHREKPLYFFIERYEKSFIDELNEFVMAIIENKQPPVTGLDGKKAFILGTAAKKSFIENRPVRC